MCLKGMALPWENAYSYDFFLMCLFLLSFVLFKRTLYAICTTMPLIDTNCMLREKQALCHQSKTCSGLMAFHRVI